MICGQSTSAKISYSKARKIKRNKQTNKFKATNTFKTIKTYRTINKT